MLVVKGGVQIHRLDLSNKNATVAANTTLGTWHVPHAAFITAPVGTLRRVRQSGWRASYLQEEYLFSQPALIGGVRGTLKPLLEPSASEKMSKSASRVLTEARSHVAARVLSRP